MLGIIHNKVLLPALLVIVFFVLVPMGVAHGQTWSAQTSGLTAQTLYDVFFADASTGWAVGDAGTIRATTNGGTTWSAQTSGVSGFLYSIFFINSTTGWAVGENGTILKTTNGGNNWTAQTSGTTKPLKSVFFINSTTGWAVGENGTVRATTNGGTTWSAQNSGIVNSDNLYDEFFANASTGWAVGDDNDTPSGVIYTTTNGGTTWTAQTPGSISALRGVFFVDSSTGWAVGYGGTILTTTNGGTTWTAQTSGTTADLYDAFFVNSSTGWAVGVGGKILKFTGASSPSSSSNPRRPLTFEEQRRQLALRLAPNAPRDARVVLLPCREGVCPIEIIFTYNPNEFHKGMATLFALQDDAGRTMEEISAFPQNGKEYRVTVASVKSNQALSGKLCAIVGGQQSCAPVSGFANIAIAPESISVGVTLLDIAKKTHRVSFAVSPLPTNYRVGVSGVKVFMERKMNGAKERIAERLYKFSSLEQPLYDALPAGRYEVTFVPKNVDGKDGETIVKELLLNGEESKGRDVKSAKTITGKIDISGEVERITQRLGNLFNQLKAMLDIQLQRKP